MLWDGIPILLLVTTPRIALGVTLPILLVIDVWVLYAMRDKINRNLLVIMTIFGMAGHGIGWVFFDYISNDMLTAFIGGCRYLPPFYFKTPIWSGTAICNSELSCITHAA